jgi:hypothetical protein
MAGSMRLVAQPDTWELRVFIGRDSLGKIKHRYVRFRGTRRQGGRELARLVIDQEDKPVPLIESELAWNSSPLSTMRSPHGARTAGMILAQRRFDTTKTSEADIFAEQSDVGQSQG